MAAKVIELKSARGEREAQLLAQGWAKQTTIDEPRLSELIETYRALGYEVEVIEHRSEAGSCSTCFDAGTQDAKVYADIWLRRKPGAANGHDELF